MSDAGVVSAVVRRLRRAGHDALPGGSVTLSVAELAALMSQHNVEVVQQFVRLQRKAGIQTVRYAAGESIGVGWLVERMAEFDLLLAKDKSPMAQSLREQIVDLLPVVDQRLFSLCNQHMQLSDFGLVADEPL